MNCAVLARVDDDNISLDSYAEFLERLKDLIYDFLGNDLKVEICGNEVIDITVSGESIGYYATKALCDVYGLTQAELLYQGDYETLLGWVFPMITIEELNEMSIVPLFGVGEA